MLAGVTTLALGVGMTTAVFSQVRRSLASTAQDDQLLPEQEILRDQRSHATGATQLRGHAGQVTVSRKYFMRETA